MIYTLKMTAETASEDRVVDELFTASANLLFAGIQEGFGREHPSLTVSGSRDDMNEFLVIAERLVRND